MRARTALFAAGAILGAALFASLGFWQIDRLRQRQALNSVLAARLSAPLVAADSVGGVAEELRFRRARLSGRADYDRELVVAQRSRNGSPGIWLATPVISPGSDSATIVIRGWVYSPDGSSVDRSRWREGPGLTVDGWLDTLGTSGSSDSMVGRPGTVRRLDQQRIAAQLGRPVRRMYLMAARGDAEQRADVPARFTLPEPDEGPHLGYAFQWFSFAAIALVGGGIIVVNDRRARRADGERVARPRIVA